MNSKMKKILSTVAALVILILAVLNWLGGENDQPEVPAAQAPAAAVQQTGPIEEQNGQTELQEAADGAFSLSQVPEWTGEYTDYFAVINNNVPYFTPAELEEAKSAYESYSELDPLGRCGPAVASVGRELMPTEARGSISSVHPTGWVNESYEFINGKKIYNRSHLLGYTLTGENANEKNLITGTRYLNEDGMIPFENMVEDYVKETGGHVLYRVTPIFEGDNLVASGVLMEGQSIEDGGKAAQFNVFCYNVQPGCIIDYASGENTAAPYELPAGAAEQDYVLNVNSKKFHLPACSGAQDMKKDNRGEMHCAREFLLKVGYKPCSSCNP